MRVSELEDIPWIEQSLALSSYLAEKDAENLLLRELNKNLEIAIYKAAGAKITTG